MGREERSDKTMWKLWAAVAKRSFNKKGIPHGDGGFNNP
jgi:hypothetical protein